VKSLVYNLREDLIACFKNMEEVFQKPGSVNKHLLPEVKKDLKRLKDPTISPVAIIETAKRLTLSAISQFPEEFKSTDERTSKYFYETLLMTYVNDFGFKYPKKYYYFVPDFAENLRKVKIPNLEKLTLNDVFPNDGSIYFEIIFKDEILSFLVHHNDKGQIDGFMTLYFPVLTSQQRNDITAPLPSHYGSYDRDDKDIGDDLFKDAWEKDEMTWGYVSKKSNPDGISFVASCLLYIQSGDPDIRHMKGENSQKYKINSKDSFFEKRKKQEGVKDAIFNDYELVGWNYKKKYNVAGHWRYQAYGPKWSQHKLIFIESFEKGTK